MTFFANPFEMEFRGNLLLSDRQYNVSFNIKPNVNTFQLMTAWNVEPWDISAGGANLFTLNYSYDSGMTWTLLTVDVSVGVADLSAALTTEIVAAFNNNATFATLYTAVLNTDKQGNPYLQITAIRPRTSFRTYITDGGAEAVFRFNKKSGVAELPIYFSKHTIANVNNYPDSVGMLVPVDPTTTTGQQIIKEAGYAYEVGLSSSSETVTIADTAPFLVGDSVVLFDGTTTVSATINAVTTNTSLTVSTNWTGSTDTGSLVIVHADWQLLRGRSGIFNFQNITVDGSSRVTQIIEYPAGALPGDLAKKVIYIYSGANTNPSQITEIPYVLTSNDLVIP